MTSYHSANARSLDAKLAWSSDAATGRSWACSLRIASAARPSMTICWSSGRLGRSAIHSRSSGSMPVGVVGGGPQAGARSRANPVGAQTQPTHTNVKVVQEGTLTSLELWNSGSLERRSAATHTHTRRTTSAQSSASAQTQPAHNASQRTMPASAQFQPARNPSRRANPASAQLQPAHSFSQRANPAGAQTQLAQHVRVSN